MLRLVSALVCLGALEAAVVSACHRVEVDAAVPVPHPPGTDGVLFDGKKASEQTFISLPLKNVVANVSRNRRDQTTSIDVELAFLIHV